MYKIENNVQWTTELKEAFKHNITRAQILYKPNEELLTELSEELLTEDGFIIMTSNNSFSENNHIVRIEIEDDKFVPDVGFIGQAIAKKVNITLLNINERINLENKEITIKIGADYNGKTYYINYGNYIVNAPPENDDTNGQVKLQAYDYMIKFNQPYVDRVHYPCTLKTLLIDICNQAGIELATQEFSNYDFVVENNQFEGKQLREVLQNIAKCAFSWARIGQDNKLYLDFEVDDTTTETITKEEYKQNSFKIANEYYGKINKVTYADTDIQGIEEYIKDDVSIGINGEREFIIYNNLFAYTRTKRAELIRKGYHLFGLQYMPIQQMDMIGLIYLDCNDIIELRDTRGYSYISRVFNHKIIYNGITNDSVETEASSVTEETYKNFNNEVAYNSKIDLSVDRANKRITSLIEQVDDISSKSSSITQELDSINQKIQSSANYKRSITSQNILITEQDTAPTRIYRFVINGGKEYNNYLYSGDDEISDTTYCNS